MESVSFGRLRWRRYRSMSALDRSSTDPKWRTISSCWLLPLLLAADRQLYKWISRFSRSLLTPPRAARRLDLFCFCCDAKISIESFSLNGVVFLSVRLAPDPNQKVYFSCWFWTYRCYYEIGSNAKSRWSLLQLFRFFWVALLSFSFLFGLLEITVTVYI